MIFALIPGVLCLAAGIAAFLAPGPNAWWLLAIFAAIAGLPHLLLAVLYVYPSTAIWWIDRFIVALAVWSEFLALGLWGDYQGPSAA
jgi:hypothetical protein